MLNKQSFIVAVVAIALFMEMLDTTIINTAIPEIARTFTENPVSLKLALSSYLLSLAVFIPVSGWAADKFGTRNVFMWAMTIFLLGSLFSGISTNLAQLVIARLVQGVGGAMMVPVGNIIILRSVPKKESVNAMATVSMLSLIGPTLGPVVGGFFTTYISWRWNFFINIPMGILGLYCAAKYVDNYRIDEREAFDTVGFILFGTGCAGILFGLTAVGENMLSLLNSVLLLGLSFGCFLGYAAYYKKNKKPIFDLRLFEIRTFWVTVCGGFVSRLGLAATPFLLPLLYQVVLHFSPLLSGILTLPAALGALCVKPCVKPLLARFGFRKVLLVTSVLLALATVQLAFNTAASSLTAIALRAFIYGNLASLQFGCFNTLTYADIDQKKLSKASSMARTIQQLSMSFGVAVGAILLHTFAGDFSHHIVLSQHVLSYTLCAVAITPILGLLIFRKLHEQDGSAMSAYSPRIK